MDIRLWEFSKIKSMRIKFVCASSPSHPQTQVSFTQSARQLSFCVRILQRAAFCIAQNRYFQATHQRSFEAACTLSLVMISLCWSFRRCNRIHLLRWRVCRPVCSMYVIESTPMWDHETAFSNGLLRHLRLTLELRVPFNPFAEKLIACLNIVDYRADHVIPTFLLFQFLRKQKQNKGLPKFFHVPYRV